MSRPPQKPRDDREMSNLEVNEASLTENFVGRYTGELLFDHSAGRWFKWTGTHWKRNEKKLAFHYARELCIELSDWKSSLSKASVADAVERGARAVPEMAVTADEWDTSPMLLCTPGDTVDLTTGKLEPARPQDRITKQAGVAPVSGKPERWLRFLEEATAGDKELVRFLQQVGGYCLTGLTTEHALFFIHGSGGNGKSVFLNILNHVLGDYATTASMDTFTASRSERHPTDLAMLNGARLVSASETEEGKPWAESRIKQVTGGDKISARFMRQDFFEFVPQFKLLIVGNHAPVLGNVDEAMRRRFNIIPFTHKPQAPDRDLEEKLKAEAGQILQWFIEGCLDWRANGLVRPEVVKAVTAEYFEEQDLFGQWLEERCERRQGEWELSTALFSDWDAYAKANGEGSGTQKAVAAKLRREGFKPVKILGGLRGWGGLKLRPRWNETERYGE